MGAKRKHWKKRVALLARDAEKHLPGSAEGKEIRRQITEIMKAHPAAANYPAVLELAKFDISKQMFDIPSFKLLNFFGWKFLTRTVVEFNSVFTTATFGFLAGTKRPVVVADGVPPKSDSVVKIGKYRFRVLAVHAHSQSVDLMRLNRIRDRVREWSVSLIDSVITKTHSLIYRER